MTAVSTAARPVAAVLRTRYVPRLLGSTLVGRLPTGMTSLAVVLLVRGRGGDYALAGTLAGGWALGSAMGAPVLSRAADRLRQPPVLLLAALVSAAAFAVLAVLDPANHPVAAGLVLLLAGIATPPLEPCLRVLWTEVLPDEDAVHAAYSLDAAAQELIFTFGPLLVVAAVAIAGPAGGVGAAAGVGLAGTLIFATSRPCRGWRPSPTVRHWAGPLRSAALIRICIAILFVGATIGIFTVAITAHAEAVATRSAAAWLIAANAAGALLAGILFTAVRPAGNPGRRLCLLTAFLAAGYAPLIGGPGLYAALPLALVSGLALSPLLATTFVIVDRVAPEGTVTEAFAWLVTAFGVGAAAGSAAAGSLVDGPGFALTMLVAVASAALAAAILGPPV